ncbi:MAG: OprO/OprP family phosphate-selective porin [Prevotellaceae bacterium]|jgi:hypothetical protein|nr:OprO/OprP family phosphate-selective porin [Prevotellaceae bacterium]
MIFKNKKSTFVLFCLFVPVLVFSQHAATDSLTKNFSHNSQSIISNFKITGFVHVDYQLADTAGQASLSGGKFPNEVDNRFLLRRCQIKFTYETRLTTASAQLYTTENGIGLKDAFITLNTSWKNRLSFTGGLFDRPFGYEIAYSATRIESTERSRITMALFPGEKDLGAKIALKMPLENDARIQFDLGTFNGNGPGTETDSYKDFIGHLWYATNEEKALKASGGVSYYRGGFAEQTDNSYEMKSIDGVKVFAKNGQLKGDQARREYIGIDAQASYDWWAGTSAIRAEYLWGTQPASAENPNSLKTAIEGDTYLRNFNGYYVYFIQNIGKTPFQAVLKYDVYDPNTAVSGNEIGISSSAPDAKATGVADVKYSTFGVGLNYYWNEHVRLTVYYDMPRNETTRNIHTASTLTNLAKDRKDNLLTFRLMYRF